MKEQKKVATGIGLQKLNCNWVDAQVNELKALLSYNSESMVARNKVRALSSIDTAMQSLSEIRAYIEGVADAFNSSSQNQTGFLQEEPVCCKECEHLMFSDCYGECSKGYKGIVKPYDTCGHGVRKKPKEAQEV